MDLRQIMNVSPRGWAMLFVLAAACPWSVAAHANLIGDPGFETENASGGPVFITNPVTWVFGGDAGIEQVRPASGANNAFLGTGTATQSLSLVAGATYSISFELAADQTTLSNATAYDVDTLNGTVIPGTCSSDPTCFNASISVSFDGQSLDTILADGGQFFGAGSYITLPYTAIANNASGALSFTSSQNPNAGNIGLWYLDNIDIECTANCSIVTIPEPSDMLLALTALAAFPFVARGRRRLFGWRR